MRKLWGNLNRWICFESRHLDSAINTTIFLFFTFFVFVVAVPIEFVVRLNYAIVRTGYKLAKRGLTKFRP